MFRRSGRADSLLESGRLSLAWSQSPSGPIITDVGLSYAGVFCSSVPGWRNPAWYRSPWLQVDDDWRLGNFLVSRADGDDARLSVMKDTARQAGSWAEVTVEIDGSPENALGLTIGEQALVRAALPRCNLMIWVLQPPTTVGALQSLEHPELQPLLDAHNASLDVALARIADRRLGGRSDPPEPG